MLASAACKRCKLGSLSAARHCSAVELSAQRCFAVQPVEDAAATLAAALPGLEASDWLEAVKALNLLRQLAVHHPDTCATQL